MAGGLFDVRAEQRIGEVTGLNRKVMKRADWAWAREKAATTSPAATPTHLGTIRPHAGILRPLPNARTRAERKHST
jgi:hypothetical protein